MRKFYALLAAAFVASAASASVPMTNAKVANSSDAQLCTVIGQNERIATPSMKPQQAPAKAVSSRDDLLGPHTFTYIWGLQSDDQFGGVLSPYFSAGEQSNEIVITGLPYSDVPIVASVDMSAMTLTIAKQEGWYASNYEEMVYITPMEWTSNTTIGEKSTVVGNIDADGNITFPETDIICAKISQGYFFMFYAMEFNPLQYVTVDEAEFVDGGSAVFTEYVLNCVVAEKPDLQVAPQTVSLLKSADGNTIVVKNPYGSSAWSKLNDGFSYGSDTNGYLWIDVTDPECVLLRPLVASGCYINDAGEGEEPYLQQLYPFNDEGDMYYEQGYDTDEIWMEFAAVEAPLSTYDTESGVIDIINLWFGISDSPLSKYYFAVEDEAGNNINTMYYKFELSDSGVKGLGSDNNGSKRYFNLQGVEIQNPASGELVIVKEGNKARKTIVR